MQQSSALWKAPRARVIALVAALVLPVCAPAFAAGLFDDGFESGNLSKAVGAFRWSGSAATVVSNERAKTGSYSLKFTFGPNTDGEDAFSEQGFNLGGSYTEVWVRYDLYIPSNYNHRSQSDSANNKGFLYLWSGPYGSPTGPGLGPNFWPLGIAAPGESRMKMYAWGPGLDVHYEPSVMAIEAADYGKWVQIVAHYKYATSANNNGVAEIWKTRDGVRKKLLSITNGNWYVAGQPGFQQGYLLGWSNSGFTQETKLFIDNVAVSTTSLLDDVLIPKAPALTVD